MKTKLLILSFILPFMAVSQVLDTIRVPSDKFIMLHFPAKIEFKQISASIDDKIGIKMEAENIFLQFVDKKVPETNIMIKTIDGNFYSFIMKYDEDPKKLNYFFSTADALNSEGSKKTKSVDPVIDVSSKKNKGKSNKEVTEISGDIGTNLLNEKGYLKSRNVITKKNIKTVLKGIYTNEDKMYFLFNIKNTGNIVYDIDMFSFFVSNQKNMESSTEQSTEVYPISIENKFYSLKAEDKNILFVFKKFTIDEDKILKFEIVEKNGDRSITFPILPTQIDSARKINN